MLLVLYHKYLPCATAPKKPGLFMGRVGSASLKYHGRKYYYLSVSGTCCWVCYVRNIFSMLLPLLLFLEVRRAAAGAFIRVMLLPLLRLSTACRVAVPLLLRLLQ